MNMSSLKTYSGPLLMIMVCIIAEANNMLEIGEHHSKKASYVRMIHGKTHLRSDGGFSQQMQSVKDGVKGMETKFTELGKRMNEMQAKDTKSEENTNEKLHELEKDINSLKSKSGCTKDPAKDIDAKLDRAIRKELDKRMNEIEAAAKKSIKDMEDILNGNLQKTKNELRKEINMSAQCEEQIVYEVKEWIYKNSPNPNAAFKVLNIEAEYKVSLNYRTTANKNYLAIDPSGTRSPEEGLQIYFPANGSLVKANIPITVNKLYYVEFIQEKNDQQNYHISIRANNKIFYTEIIDDPGTPRAVIWSEKSDPINAAEISNMNLYNKGMTKQIVNKCYWLDGGRLLAFVGFVNSVNRRIVLEKNMTFDDCLNSFRKKHASDATRTSMEYRPSEKECLLGDAKGFSQSGWKYNALTYQVAGVQ